MDSGDLLFAIEVGQRPGHPQGPMVTARAQGQRVGGIAQELEAGRLGT
jgi:hypothetical protein